MTSTRKQAKSSRIFYAAGCQRRADTTRNSSSANRKMLLDCPQSRIPSGGFTRNCESLTRSSYGPSPSPSRSHSSIGSSINSSIIARSGRLGLAHGYATSCTGDIGYRFRNRESSPIRLSPMTRRVTGSDRFAIVKSVASLRDSKCHTTPTACQTNQIARKLHY